MRVVNFSDARKSLNSIIDQVIDDADYTVITRRDVSDVIKTVQFGWPLGMP